MTSDPHETYVLVVCPLCHTRMHPRREQIGRQIKCPDCGTVSPVLPPRPTIAPHERADPGEYGLREAAAFGDPTAIVVNVPAPTNAPVPAEPAPPVAPRPAPPALILVTCPLCHTRMHPPLSDRGKRIKCPDCGTEVVVPTSENKLARKQAPDLVAGHYDMGRAPVAAAPRVGMLLAAQAVPSRQPLAEPPKWTMFSGVFSFPFQREAISRWLYLTIGLLLIGEILVFATGGLDGSFGGTAAAAALGGVILILSIWTVSFAAACLLTVIRETATGVDVVEDWPESDWREWLWPLLYSIQVLGLSAGIAYGLSWILHTAGAGESTAQLAGAAMVALMFPVLMLSVIENGSALAFYSPPVLRSLVRLPHYWLLFQLETILPLAGIAALIVLGVGHWAFYVVLAAAPLLAAHTLIYARLLGRMAWQVGELEERRAADEDEETD